MDGLSVELLEMAGHENLSVELFGQAPDHAVQRGRLKGRVQPAVGFHSHQIVSATSVGQGDETAQQHPSAGVR